MFKSFRIFQMINILLEYNSISWYGFVICMEIECLYERFWKFPILVDSLLYTTKVSWEQYAYKIRKSIMQIVIFFVAETFKNELEYWMLLDFWKQWMHDAMS